MLKTLCLILALAFAVALPAEAQMRNRQSTILPSAVRAVTYTGTDIANDVYNCLTVIFDITSAPGVDTVLLTIQGKDATSGKYYTILAGSAESAAATKTYKVCPGMTVAANVSASDIVPAVWRITITHSAGTNFTYSVGYNINY